MGEASSSSRTGVLPFSARACKPGGYTAVEEVGQVRKRVQAVQQRAAWIGNGS
jgi:hypothetical protein